MFLIITCQRQAIVLMKMNKNLNILKTNIPDLDVLSSPLLDFLKIGIRYLNFLFRKGEGIFRFDYFKY